VSEPYGYTVLIARRARWAALIDEGCKLLHRLLTDGLAPAATVHGVRDALLFLGENGRPQAGRYRGGAGAKMKARDRRHLMEREAQLFADAEAAFASACACLPSDR
tara:strand:+ start:2456 stop:2773 length:318 start_codon:yes stop_codon:yes gene_type:complete